MSTRERDPLESQVRILFGRSGGRCAYPKCGKVLVIPSRDSRDLPKNVAKIAHITAASPGGPRYDHSMHPEERRAESNLILLCGDHHDAVDSQLEFHTKDFLRQAKLQHERGLDRAAQYHMGLIGYKELEMICQALSLGVTVQSEDISSIEPPLDIDNKIELNGLGEESRHSIELGMAQDKEVREFLKAMDNIQLGFSSRLTDRFKALYYQARAENLSGDDLFASILGTTYLNCGPTLTHQAQAASLAVIAHLFFICEIFERA